MRLERGQSFRHRFEGPFFRNLMLAGIQRIPLALQQASLPLWAGIFFTALPAARRAVASNLRRAADTPAPPVPLVAPRKRPRAGDIVAMQLDPRPGGAQAEVPVSGPPVPSPLGAATLARTSGCPLIPVFAVYTGARQITVHYEEPI